MYAEGLLRLKSLLLVEALMVEFKTFKLSSMTDEGHGFTIPPRSVVRMRVERPEMPFGFVRFESKVRSHNEFKG